MKTRIITSVVGISLLALVLFFIDTFVFNIVFLAVCMLAIHEVYHAFNFGKRSIYIYLSYLPLAALILLSDFRPIRTLLIPFGYLFVIALALSVVFRYDSINFQKLSGMTVFSAVIIFCFYSFIHLKTMLPRAEYGYDAIYFVVLILGYAWGGDTAAYFTGRALGKHKLAPAVSPNKTVEGAIGGVFGSVAAGLLISLVYIQLFSRVFVFSRVKLVYYLIVALLGIVASLLGILGDLFASAVKRQCGIKDYGSIFPGHGGILDRFDSVLFIAPLVSMVITMVYLHFRL